MSARCCVFAGPDRCLLPPGHDLPHKVSWEGVAMLFDGDEEWAHDHAPTEQVEP